MNPSPFSASSQQLLVKMRGQEYGPPKELTKEQIKTEVVDRFVFAAKYAKEVGFDGIQVGFLIVNFCDH